MPNPWGHLVVLALCVGLVLLAALMQPTAPGETSGLTIGGYRIPETCSFKRFTGVPCPGCGLTRSWVSALHGDLRTSLGFHPLGWLVLAYTLAQAVRHGAWLLLPRARVGLERWGARLDYGLIGLTVVLFVAWLPVAYHTLTRLL